mmetsp:Transcript_708/g.1127  ORF Transcript_708/g.1127 Transcript_708/m.1127 type:complete len:520 (-) Transcript_708:203-1762(-)
MTNGTGNEPIPPFVIKATIAASLGGILFGYDMGVTSTALPQLTNVFNLTEGQQEMLVSFLYIGCIFGATVGGYLCDRHGRKKTILVTDCVFILGAYVLYSASTFDVVLFGRILIGFAVAVSAIADVAYLHEISPRQYRGAIVSCNEACISLGFMLSYLTGYGISVRVGDNGWRYMFGLGAIIAVLQFVGMLFMPESPVWLRSNGELEAAEKVVLQIGFSMSEDTHDNHAFNAGGSKTHLFGNGKGTSDESDSPDYSSFNIEQPVSMENVPEPDGLTMVTMRKYFRQIIIAVFLSVMQNFCGHPNVLNFAPEIFAQIGFDSEEGRLISTTFLGVVKFVTVCYTIKRVEIYGRRYLLLFGMSIIAFSLFVLSLAYFVTFVKGGGEMSILGKVFATLSVFGVAGGYSLSFGPLVWLIVSELFPSTIRGRALGGSTICGYAAASLVSYTFLTGQDVGLFVPFAIYCFLTVLSIGFAYVYIPDTAGKTPDEIHQELSSGWGSNRFRHRPSFANVVQAENDRGIV